MAASLKNPPRLAGLSHLLRSLPFFPRPDAERQWSGPFCFIQAADPQLGLMKAWRDGDCDGGGEEWAEEVELTQRAVDAVNRLRPRPRFMVLCGDLVHAMPGRDVFVLTPRCRDFLFWLF